MSCLGGVTLPATWTGRRRWTAGALPRLELLAGSQAEWAIRRGRRLTAGGMMVAVSRVTIVGAPTSAGAYAPGQEEGPRAMRDAGLLDALAARGVEVADAGDVEAFRWAPDPGRPRAANLAAVADRARQVAALVAGADSTVLVLGGDCTVELGTVAGLRDRVERLGLVYLDLHADLNVPSSVVDGALDWMGVAHLLDVEGAESELAGIGSSRPLLEDDQLVFLGVKPGTEFEQATIEQRGLAVVDVDALGADPERAASQALGALGGMRRRRRALRRRPRPLPRRAARREHRPRGRHARGRRHRLTRPHGGPALPRADRDRAQPVPRRRRRLHDVGGSSRCSLARCPDGARDQPRRGVRPPRRAAGVAGPAEVLDAIAAAGFSGVRLPVRWANARLAEVAEVVGSRDGNPTNGPDRVLHTRIESAGGAIVVEQFDAPRSRQAVDLTEPAQPSDRLTRANVHYESLSA